MEWRDKMNGTLDESSTNNLIPPWKIEYQQALATGVSVETLLDDLEEALKIEECSIVWSHKELEDMSSVEALAQSTIHYKERLAYLQNIIDSKCRKTM